MSTQEARLVEVAVVQAALVSFPEAFDSTSAIELLL